MKSILHCWCRCNRHHHNHPVHPTWQHTSVSHIAKPSTWQHRRVIFTSRSINYSGQTVMTNPSSFLSWQRCLMLSGQQQTGTLCRPKQWPQWCVTGCTVCSCVSAHFLFHPIIIQLCYLWWSPVKAWIKWGNKMSKPLDLCRHAEKKACNRFQKTTFLLEDEDHIAPKWRQSWLKQHQHFSWLLWQNKERFMSVN